MRWLVSTIVAALIFIVLMIVLVDPSTMGVHGLQRIRVVDASAMRYVTNGNIYAPVMMMAEKAADLILGNTPLAPEPVPFYRSG